MTSDILDALKHRFFDYVESFIAEAADPWPYVFRRDHTSRVCQEILSLGKEIRLSEEDLLLAEAAALLHDIGRFQQVNDYGTFSDRRSLDHARLGIKVIQKLRLLDSLSVEERALLEEAVACHNMPRIPPDRTGRRLLFIKILRDADKLDIWKTAIDSYRNPDGIHEVFRSGVAFEGAVSEKIVEAIAQKQPASVEDIKNINDFKLLQVSWVFDLNFTETMERVRKRGIIQSIFATLPESAIMQRLSDNVQNYLQSGTMACPRRKS